MKKVCIAIVSLTFFFTSCKETGSSETKDVKVAGNDTKQDVKDEIKEAKAICLYDNLSIRDKPSQKGKWLASMSLGETITFTGEEVVDSISKRKYCKIKLTDGKEGWTRTDLIAVNGKVGTLKDEAVVYKRPDLLTKTDKKYSPMDIIAIIVTDGEWLQVKGKRATGKYIEEGWIKSSNISNSSVDIATAKFAGMAINKPSMTEKIKALQEVTNNSDLSTSSFIPLLEEKIKDYQDKNIAIEPEAAIEESTE